MKLKDADNLYYIGGIVRDEILGKPSFDIDLTYVGNAIEFAQNIDDVKILKINEPFGTVRIKAENKEIDIASTRAEIYEQAGHLPTVTQIGCSLKEDVLRRDFTINAMAKSVKDNKIIDYTGGLEDIKNKKIRILHDNSFIDDPTRILRALKFAVRFDFSLDEHSKELRDKYLENVNYDMSFKRVKKELIETFNLNSQAAYDEFISSKIYKLITPSEITKSQLNIEQLINKYIHLINPDNIWLVYVGTIRDLDNLKPTLTKEEQKIISDAYTATEKNLNNDYEIYKTFENMKAETILLYAVIKNQKVAEHYLSDLKDIKIQITGKDLMEMNIPPSTKYQECFDYILKTKLYNPNLTIIQEKSLAKEFFSTNC